MLNLAPGPDALLAGMRKSTRRQIRRAEQEGVEVHVGRTPSILAAYLSLWRTAVEAWASKQNEPVRLARVRSRLRDHPRRLSRLAEHLGDRFTIWVAHHEGRPVAANVAAHGSSSHVMRAVMDRTVEGSRGVMPYLDWLAMLDAHSRGSLVLHLGESGNDESLSFYKEGLGAEAWDYVEVRLEKLPVTPVDRALREAVKKVIRFDG